jgi:hypothetical protein
MSRFLSYSLIILGLTTREPKLIHSGIIHPLARVAIL